MLDMTGSKNQEGRTASVQDFAVDHVGRVLISRGGDLFPRRSIVDIVPVDWRIREHNAKVVGRFPCPVDRLHCSEELLVDRCIPDEDVDGLTPDMNELR